MSGVNEKQNPNLIRSKLSSKNTMSCRKLLCCVVSKDGLNSTEKGQAIPTMPNQKANKTRGMCQVQLAPCQSS